MKTKNISKFVIDFIQEHKSEDDIVSKWNSQNNLNALKKILTKDVKTGEKDKNKPKRGKSSYLHFCEANREQVKKEFPHYNNKEIVTELGHRWNRLKQEDPDKIKEYDEISQKDRERYKNEMSTYEKNKDSDSNDSDVEIKEEIKPKKEKKEKKPKKEKKLEVIDEVETVKEEVKKEEPKKEKPKKEEKKVEEQKKIKKDDDDFDKGFYSFFLKKKDKYPDLDEDALIKKLKKKWNALSDDKKEKYN